MTGGKLQDMTTDQLIERFIALALGQAEAASVARMERSEIRV
jgi:hypothetical protein